MEQDVTIRNNEKCTPVSLGHACFARCLLGILSAVTVHTRRRTMAERGEGEWTWKHVHNTHTRGAHQHATHSTGQQHYCGCTARGKISPFRLQGSYFCNCACTRLMIRVCVARVLLRVLCGGWAALTLADLGSTRAWSPNTAAMVRCTR